VSKKKVFTTGETAKWCGVNFRTVLRWIERGQLNAYRLPGKRGDFRITSDSLLTFLHENQMPIPDEFQGKIEKNSADTRSDNEKIKAQLIQAQKMGSMGKLIHGIAHDYNNLISVINGYADILQERYGDEPMLKECLGEISKAGKRAANLGHQLLIFSNRPVVQPQILNVNDILVDLGKMLRRLIPENIGFENVLEEEIGFVKVDPGQFHQVIVNLVINAVHAVGPKGKIIIETKKVFLDQNDVSKYAGINPGEFVLLTVSDNGTGMSETIKRRILEPFFTTEKEGEKTTGLTASVEIIKQAGGYIGIDSQLTQGSILKVFLPIFHNQSTNSAGDQNGSNSFPGGSETILLVEDEHAVRKLAAKILSQRGYQILEVANGEEALELARRTPLRQIRLLLTDVVMPNMGGVRLAELLCRFCPRIKVLFLSGYADSIILGKEVAHLQVGLIQKPFTASILLHRVRAALDS
jgi:two-component system, cell cycle sensor histidine kinase and response regulator CckA